LVQKTGAGQREVIENMGWSDIFKRNESALRKLSTMIFKNSLLCAESLRPDLEEKFGKGTQEFKSKYIQVLFEFMYFFFHLTNRSAFRQLGQEKRTKLQHNLGPPAIEAAIRTLLEGWPPEKLDEIEKDFYHNLNNAEMDYGACKHLLMKPEDDTSNFDKIESGKKSKSIVGQLADNLSEIIEGGPNMNLFFTMKIWDVVIEILKKKEIDSLVLAASKGNV
jgi:hypothetical protein